MSAPAPAHAPSLILFTTSQTALPVRYAHPSKPTLVIPPLVHRSLHNALDGDAQSALLLGDQAGSSSGRLIIPHPDGLIKHDLPSHNLQGSSSQIRIDEANSSPSGVTISNLPESESIHSPLDIELTVKLHLVAPSPTPPSSAFKSTSNGTSTRGSWISEALSILSEYKGLSRDAIDTLLIGFKGIDYRGEKNDPIPTPGTNGTNGTKNTNGNVDDNETIPSELEEEVLEIFQHLEEADVGKETKLGILYSPLGLLKKLVEQVGDAKTRKVGVNALDTPDCHHLPKEYTGYARENGIELWAGSLGEGSDPLPSAHLHNLLQEFVPALGAIGQPQPSLQKLGKLIPVREDGSKFDDQRETGVEVRWVLSYTLVSKTRNVVKDKGYIIAADFAS
ncbi:hypothetical protein CI109_102667 [Kwoniella shandongensis]|uniref:Uncharacterized protein n=1 Tax=Kwoniella shandongensis TaxID=1734106 RepID=A0A5M6BUG6_9TREE|nr:uncharacterized protein CI109_005247 [Kwoniella shandongensis]KAA5526477.1 hypothetical protein CI109_005247 [Kwoniella shandongensis]